MDSSDSEMEIDEEDWEDIEPEEASGDTSNKNKGGRPLKPFSTNGPTQRRVKLTEPYLACEKASKKHGIDFIPLLGKLPKMYTDSKQYLHCWHTFQVILQKCISTNKPPTVNLTSFGWNCSSWSVKALILWKNILLVERKQFTCQRM